MTNLDAEIKRIKKMIKDGIEKRIIYANFSIKDAEERIKELEWLKKKSDWR